GMSGFEVATRLRRQDGGTGPLRIAITGYGQASDVQRATEAGFNHHFVKPIDPEGLLGLLAADAPRATTPPRASCPAAAPRPRYSHPLATTRGDLAFGECPLQPRC